MNQVALNGDVSAAVHVDAVRTPAAARIRLVALRRDVVDRVLADVAVTRLVVGGVRRNARSRSRQYRVVVVVDQVVTDGEGVDVAVEGERRLQPVFMLFSSLPLMVM